MVHVQYVYPNVSELSQRGGLGERGRLAASFHCDYVEIPADFIKNKTEVEKTGLRLGDFLTKEAIAALYDRDKHVAEDIRYILHTEPSLPRDDGYGVLYQSSLNWRQKAWVKDFTTMVINISGFFGKPAIAVEIHPGDIRNSFEDLVSSIRHLLTSYSTALGAEPLALVENRTGQFISNGKDIADFWEFLSNKHTDLQSKVGIVLDIQQLYTVTRKGFLKHLALIPNAALKGFHIHCKHRAPELSDEIPWRIVFSKIANIRGEVLINPEIHHRNNVEKAIMFCERMIHDANLKSEASSTCR